MFRQNHYNPKVIRRNYGGKIMSEDLTEKRIADALERIAKALETVADKPQWVKIAEEVVGEVKKIEQKAPVVEKPAPEPVKEAAVMETVQKATETIQEDDLVGQTVVIVGGDHNGKIGVCTKRMKAWALVNVDGEDISVRPSHLRVQDADVNEAIEAKVEEVATMPATESVVEVEAIGTPPSEDADDSANFVIRAGKHAGKTMHTLFNESSLGTKTVVWMAKNHNLADHKEAAISYLKANGVEY
jgi:hypothetical protein